MVDTKPSTPQEQAVLQYGDTLKALVTESLEPEVSSEKLLQYLKWKRADLYYRGLHHVYPDIKPNGQVDLVGSTSPTFTSSPNDSGSSDYNFRVVGKYGEKFVAVMGARPFDKVRAVADDPKNEQDKDAARQANLGISILRSWWKVGLQNYRLAFNLFKSGTVYPYVRWVTHKRFGVTQVPNITQKEVPIGERNYYCGGCNSEVPQAQVDENGGTCPNCGAPVNLATLSEPETVNIAVHEGYQSYPNGRAVLQWCNATTVTGPFSVQDIEDWGYFVMDTNEPRGKMMSAYPHLRDKLKDGAVADGSSITTQGSLVRSGAQSQTGIPKNQNLANPILWRRIWITPERLEEIKDDKKRAEIMAAYPDGLKLVMVGEHVAEIVDEQFLNHTGACTPSVGETTHVDGLCYPLMGHQDLQNSMAELMIQHMERGLPSTLVETGLLDIDALNARRHLPQEMVEVSIPSGGSIKSMIETLPTAKFPDQLPQILRWSEDDVQSQSGLLPQVWGLTDTTRKTAEQAKSELNQALAQLGTSGEIGMAEGWRIACDRGIKLIARYAPPGLSNKGELFDAQALNAGNWHIESDVGLPLTQAERKDNLKDLIMNANTPTAQAIVASLKLDSPTNADTLQDMLDIVDLEDPTADHREAVMGILTQLMDGAPTQLPDGSMASSIPFEDFILDPQATLQQVHEYLLKPEIRKQKDTNTNGYQNVVAYGKEIEMKLNPPMPLNAPPGSGGDNGQSPNPDPSQPGMNAPPPPESAGPPPPTQADQAMSPQVSQPPQALQGVN